MLRVLRLPEVMQITGLSRATIYRRMGTDTFPQAIKLGVNSIGWSSIEVEGWIESLPRIKGLGKNKPTL